MDDTDPRLQHLLELTILEVCLSDQRREAMAEFLDAIAGFDHDEPYPLEVERLRAEVRRISSAHELALATMSCEFNARVAELGDQLATETTNVLRDVSR